MYFRSQRKLQGEVSLNEALDTGPDGDALCLSDVVGEEDTMLAVSYTHLSRDNR